MRNPPVVHKKSQQAKKTLEFSKNIQMTINEISKKQFTFPKTSFFLLLARQQILRAITWTWIPAEKRAPSRIPAKRRRLSVRRFRRRFRCPALPNPPWDPRASRSAKRGTRRSWKRTCFWMRRRISIRGRVRPSVRPSVRRMVPCYFRRWKVRILGVSCAVYPTLFL